MQPPGTFLPIQGAPAYGGFAPMPSPRASPLGWRPASGEASFVPVAAAPQQQRPPSSGAAVTPRSWFLS